jgi:hypothetical protein
VISLDEEVAQGNIAMAHTLRMSKGKTLGGLQAKVNAEPPVR